MTAEARVEMIFRSIRDLFDEWKIYWLSTRPDSIRHHKHVAQQCHSRH